MMEVYINGIGIISRCAYSKEELNSAVCGQIPPVKQLPLDFPIEIPSSRLRRNSRYNKLACAAADQALKDAGIPEMMERGDLDSHRIGTIISTGYGAAEYSSVFADSVVKEDPNGCSPLIFSGSVPNSCVGQICILNHLKGFSTVLAGGDPLEYAAFLLETGRADYILSGSVEEYFAPLYDAFGELNAAKGCDLSEGAAMAVLSRKKTGESWCRITGFSNAYLGKCPYIHCLAEGTEVSGFMPDKSRNLTGMLADVLRQMKKEEPDAVFAAANGTWFDEAESEAIRNVFPGVPVIRPKKIFGETLGCGYMMNVLLAAAAIKNECYNRVVAAGADMIGNYCCAVLASQ